MAGQWFSPSTPVSPTNKTDSHNITEILLKVELHTITLTSLYKVYISTCRKWKIIHEKMVKNNHPSWNKPCRNFKTIEYIEWLSYAMWFFQQLFTNFIGSWAILKGVRLFHYKLLTVVNDMQIAFITWPASFPKGLFHTVWKRKINTCIM